MDLNDTSFSPRMGPERLRLGQQVVWKVNIFALFCGVGKLIQKGIIFISMVFLNLRPSCFHEDCVPKEKVILFGKFVCLVKIKRNVIFRGVHK